MIKTKHFKLKLSNVRLNSSRVIAIFLMLIIHNICIHASTFSEWNLYAKLAKDQKGRLVTIDNENNAIYAGEFKRGIKLGAHTLIAKHSQNTDIFICKTTSTGQVEWTSHIYDYDEMSVQSIACDKDNNVYILFNSYKNQVVVDDRIIEPVEKGTGNMYLVKYNSNGEFQWGKCYGGNGDDKALDICTDKNRDIYLIGTFTSSNLGFGGTSTVLGSTGSFDCFIAKLDAFGVGMWSHSLGNENNDMGFAITSFTDTKDETFVYATGLINKSTGGTNFDLYHYIHKYSAAGDLIWKNDTAQNNILRSPLVNSIPVGDIDTDTQGNVYLTSTISNDVVKFGSKHTLAKNGSSDAFVAKYNHSDGACKWVFSITGTNHEYGSGICIDKSNHIFINGCFNSKEIKVGDHKLSNENNSLANYSIYLARVDTDANVNWSTVVGYKGNDISGKMVCDDMGSLYHACHVTIKDSQYDALLQKFNFQSPVMRLKGGSYNESNIYVFDMGKDVYHGSNVEFKKDLLIRNNNALDKNLTVDISTDDDNCDLVFTGNTISPGTYKTITVSFTLDQIGERTCYITIKSNDPNRKEFKVMVKAELEQPAPKLEIDDTYNYMGIIELNTSKFRYFDFKNKGNSQLRIDSIEIFKPITDHEVEPSFEVDAEFPIYIDKGTTKPLKFIFNGLRAGEITGAVYAYSNDADGEVHGFVISGVVAETSGTEEIMNDSNEITLLPNPASNIVVLSQNADIDVYNITGQLEFSSTQINQFDVSHLKSGVYLIKINSNKIIKLMVR